MTLDPVHFDGIAELAGRIRASVDATDHRAFAETVFEEFLDPLWDSDGRRVLEPLGDLSRRKIDIETAALQDDHFPTRHGLDSGTINPTTFANGLVLDVAQAAMAADPSDLDLHRGRTVVATVHSNDVTIDCTESEWTEFDRRYSRGRVLQSPRVDRYAEAVVHALSLYLAESHHALQHAGTVEDLLILDGPVYPKGILQWEDRHPELAELLVEDQRPRDVIANYVDLVETFVGRDVPLLGFVKSSRSTAITRAIRREENAPWVDDSAFFAQVLERRADRGHGNRSDSSVSRGGPDPGRDGLEPSAEPDAGERLEDCLTFTNWFVSRCGADRTFSTLGNALGVDRELEPTAYEVTFFVIYDPRVDHVYRVEAPHAFTRDADRREALTMQALRGVGLERGPPLAVAKADELARIDREEKRALVENIEETFGADRNRTYNDRRWTRTGEF